MACGEIQHRPLQLDPGNVQSMHVISSIMGPWTLLFSFILFFQYHTRYSPTLPWSRCTVREASHNSSNAVRIVNFQELLYGGMGYHIVEVVIVIVFKYRMRPDIE